MEYHPLANIVPLMEGATFDGLVADIKANGVRDPLVMFEDMLLDGRNRWRAAEAAGVTVTAKNVRQFDPKKDGNPVAWVISKNLQRRHLDESQRAWVAAKIATLGAGQRQLGKFAELVTQAEAAAMLNVSARSIGNANAVRDQGTPELQRAVEQGHIAISVAARTAKLPDDEQRSVAAKAATGKATMIGLKPLAMLIRRRAEARVRLIERKLRLSHKIIDIEKPRFNLCERYAQK
jgi:ParB-like chromosome segregation protein Spo0J